jgi:ferredoxin
MNKYNLPLDKIVEQWAANVSPQNAFSEAGVYLGAKSPKEIMVDTVKIVFPRKPDTGLGILLEEIAGGREDGLGITIVSGVVEGGAADNCGIVEGDSIASIAIKKRSSVADEDGQHEFEETVSVSTECLGYDATVDAILGLPPVESDNEIFVFSMKRLRRHPRVNLIIQSPSEPDITLELFAGENLRRAMLTRGVKLNDPFARRFDSGGTGNCGAEGTCATCVVSVLKGGHLLNEAAIQEQQMLRDKPRWRLGCKAVVGYGFQEGDITLRLNPKQWEEEMV